MEKSTSTLQLEMEDSAANSGISSATKIRRELKYRLEEFAENSSFSAAMYEFKSKSIWKRILWGLIILVAVGGFCYITAESIQMLIREPIATSITENRQTELDFPAVTVCSLSLLNQTLLDQFDNTILAKLTNLFEFARAVPPDLASCSATADDIIRTTGYSQSYSTLITRDARNDPSDLIIRCVFQGEDCSKNISLINTINGVCFTFNGPNSGPPRKTQGAGIRHGLRLELKNGDQFFSLNHNHGYSVVVHNRDEPPRPESDGIAIGQTQTLYVGMRQISCIDKTRFYSGQDCIEDSNFTSKGMAYEHFTSYSPSLCLNDCFYRFVADKCNCVENEFYSPVSSPYSEMKTCDATDLCCEVNAFETFNENCYCPLKCETITHSFTTSSATNSFSDRVGINVYYETLVTETRETTDSYTPWSLISDIGGNTGLFLGFTLLTVGEVALLVVALCTDCCCSSCNKKIRGKYTL